MTLPDGFSEWEHLQSTIIRVQNRRVREEFSDLAAADEEWGEDISFPRGSLRVACTLKDNDSAIMTLLRLWLFDVELGGASAMHPPLYTTPVERYQELITFAPQCTLYFKEDLADVEDNYAPIDAELSFRLMGQTATTLSQSEVRELAQKIHNEFATGNGYRWHKGRTKLSYRKKSEGYSFTVNAYDESEGVEVIRKVLSVQNHTLDRHLLSINQLAEAPAIVPPMQQILGKSRRAPRKRPVGYVRFIYADLHVNGIQEAICLVDRSGRRKKALISV